MTQIADLPVWAVWLTALLLLVGSGMTLIGSIGLLRLPSFYHRVHAPTLGTTGGMAAILLASMLYFTAAGSRIAVHEILIAIFVTVTTPVTLMLLARAALHRDRTEGSKDVPSADVMSGGNEASRPDA
jgi:multicomponent K+:H+ antiporter subunit G